MTAACRPFAGALFAVPAATQFLGAFAHVRRDGSPPLAAATWLGVRASTAGLMFRCQAYSLGTGCSCRGRGQVSACFSTPPSLAVVVLAAWARVRKTRVAGILAGRSAEALACSRARGQPWTRWPRMAGHPVHDAQRADGTVPVFGVLFVSAGGWGRALLAVLGAAGGVYRAAAVRFREALAGTLAAARLAGTRRAGTHPRLDQPCSSTSGMVRGLGAIVAGYGLSSRSLRGPRG